MSNVFCCSSIKPYRPRRLDHEDKFANFLSWASRNIIPLNGSLAVSGAPYAAQIVKQVNYGKQESIRYFVPSGTGSEFMEGYEDDLVKANFEKLNSYKNFRCEEHNRFFEINLYQKSPTNTHHWRATLARPSKDIDLAFRQEDDATESKKGKEMPEFKEANEHLSDTTVPSLQSQSSQTQEHAAQQDGAALKALLRFLLPTIGPGLGPTRLVSLLSLESVNKTLGLGLEFEDLWETALTTSDIAFFCLDCFEPLIGESVAFGDVENLVIPAMRHATSPPGQARLQEVVEKVLEPGHAVHWIAKYGDNLRRVLAFGPDEQLLERCRRKNQELQDEKVNWATTHLIKNAWTEDNDELAYDFNGRCNINDDYDRESVKILRPAIRSVDIVESVTTRLKQDNAWGACRSGGLHRTIYKMGTVI